MMLGVVRLLFIAGLLLDAVNARHGVNEDETKTTSIQASTQTSSSASTSLSAASSSSVASNAPQPSSLAIDQPANAITCQNMTFTWHSPRDMPLTLTVTNERVVKSAQQQPDAPLVQSTLSTTVSASGGRFDWAKVDVPQGWYSLLVFDTPHTFQVSASSPAFFIQNGSDVSCLIQSTVSTSNATTTSSGSPSATASDPRPSNSHLETGALIGTVVGVVLGVIGIVLAFSAPRLWRRALPSPHQNRPGGPYHLF